MESVIAKLSEIEAKLEAAKGDKELFAKLAERQENLAKDMLKLQQSAVKADAGKKVVSLGESFTDSDSYKAFLSGSVRSCRVELAAASTIKEIGVPVDNRGVKGSAFDRYVMEDLLAAAPTSSNLIEFVREKVWTNNAAETAEAAEKPTSAAEFEVVQAPVQVIAHWMKITKQLAADQAALAAYINSRMADGVRNRVEAEIINGDGTSPNLAGLLKAGSHTVLDATGTVIDTIAKAIATVEANGYAPSAVLMNPMDWADVALSKDKNGNYLLGGAGTADAKRIWGLPVAVSNSVPSGKYLAGDFKAAATVYTRQGITVEMFEQDDKNVQQNLITVRAECRKALAVEQPKALVGGSLVIVGG